MSTHRCEECWAILDPTKVLRCTKCKACRCSAACQKRNWRIHKRVCSTDPLLRRFVSVEMAVERSLAKQPKMAKAPKDATCYICLDGDDGGKLMRGCACRGDSAGFVHLECLAELAKSKEASGDGQAIYNGWLKCGNCKQYFDGALQVEIIRRHWRHYRSSQDLERRYNSTRSLANCLGNEGEVDAASQLLDEASTCVGNVKEALLDLKFLRAKMLKRHGKEIEALGLLQAILPEAKQITWILPLYAEILMDIAEVLLHLFRNQEARSAATEAVAFDKAKFGEEDYRTLRAMSMYAVASARLGRREEAKAMFDDVLSKEIRVLGREHPQTQYTLQHMRLYGFTVPSA